MTPEDYSIVDSGDICVGLASLDQQKDGEMEQYVCVCVCLDKNRHRETGNWEREWSTWLQNQGERPVQQENNDKEICDWTRVAK